MRVPARPVPLLPVGRAIVKNRQLRAWPKEGARLVVDASALGAGPYVVRAEAGGRSVTHRLLVTR